MLTLSALTSQNGQTHSNNSSAFADEFFECDHFAWLALKGLTMEYWGGFWLLLIHGNIPIRHY